MAAARQGFVYTDLVDYLLYGQSNSPHKTDFERPDKMDLCGKAGWPDRNIAARAQEFLKKELYALAATGVRIQALLDDSSGRDRVVQLLLHESMLNPVVEVEEK
jgi:hypothetical protein